MYLNLNKHLNRFLVSIIAFAVLSGCGQGDGPQKVAGTPQPPSVGVLIDSPVSGITWETSGGVTGITNNLGEFEYFPLETVTFSIGNFVLGTVTGAPFITVVELTGSSNPIATAATNLLVLLQSLDEDSDPANGIAISAATASMLSGSTLDFTASDFATQFALVVNTIAGPNKVVVSVASALDHFYTTYASLNGTDTFNFAFPGYPSVGGSAEQYVLVFADEFESGDAPSPLNWSIETGYGANNDGWGNNEWQLYTTDSQNVRVEDGNLVLSALCPVAPCGVRDGTVTSGKINSLNKFNFKFGKVVARIKPPVGTGAWPAFWALGANHPDVGWPHSGEIDFMEMNNSSSNDRTTHSTLHWCEDSKQAPATCTFPQGWVFDSQNRTFASSLGDAFHVWEADWNADQITVSIDGIPYYSRTIDAVNMDEFLKEFYLILNVAMGGTLGSNNQPPTGAETFPQTMLVDYVRVFQNTGGSSSSEFKLDFEAAPETYTFADFEGGVAAVITNPVSEGINTSSQVGRMLKFAGQDFGGSKLTLQTPLNVPADSKFTMKVWSPRQVPVLLKLEGASIGESSVTHSGNNWQVLTFDFGSFSGSVDGITLIFDLGETGDAAANPAEWTFYFDDIALVPPGAGDITAPKLTSVSIASSNANPALATIGDVVTVSLTADEPIMTPVVTIKGVAATVTGVGTTWQASRTLTEADTNGSVTFSIAYSDLSDNAGIVVSRSSDNSRVVVDATAPGVVISGAPATLSFSTFGPINLTFQFTEPVSGFDISDIVVTNGMVGDFVSVDMSNFTATVTPNGDGELTVNVAAGAASDVAGNLSAIATEASVFIDTVSPIIAIEDVPASFASLSPFSVTFHFSEPVSNFLISDIQTSGGSASNLIAVNGVSYTADITPNGNGDLSITVAQGAATDAVGNVTLNALEAIVSNALDADAPLFTFINITSSNTNSAFARTGDVVTIEMMSNEDILTPVVTIRGVPADAVTGSGNTWQATRIMLATDTEGPVTFKIDFEDLGGNAGPQSTVSTDATSVTFDRTAPTLSIDGVPDPILTLDIIQVTFQFVESVSGFDFSDISVTNGVADAIVSMDGGNTYTTEITPDGAGDLTITVVANAATDLAGNSNDEVSLTVIADIQPFWQLVWSDEFDGTTLDGTNWTARTNADCPAPCDGLQNYSEDNVSVAGGLLTIEALENIGPVYVSGLIDTRGKHELKYGRIEIVAKMPGALGSAPSLWMLPATNVHGAWPQSGEIDIVNAPDLGGGNVAVNHTLRYGLPTPEDTATTGTTEAINAPDENFLTYALEWEAGEIRWFVDNVHVLTQTEDNWYSYSEDTDGVYTVGTGDAPFDERFYLLLNQAVIAPVAGSPTFPQILQIDAVRVFECAFSLNPAAGTGCGTGDPTLPPLESPNVPYTVMLDVFTDAPGTLILPDTSNGNDITNELAAGFVGNVTTSDTTFVDGGNTLWRVNINALSGAGEVFIGSQDFSPDPAIDTGFNLTGADTAGELIFDMRVNTVTAGTQLIAKLDSGLGNAGQVLLPLPADTEWHIYSVKIANLLTNQTGTGLDLAKVVNLFSLEVTNGAVDLDLDNIRVKIACRDMGDCEPAARFNDDPYYVQDFEMMIPDEQMVPNTLSMDNWQVGANVFAPDGISFIYNYFSFPSPNGGSAFSAVATGQGGDEQGINQLVIYNDYNNGDHNNGRRIEANVFRERVITQDDVGRSFVFSFDAKRGNINDPTDGGCTASPNPPCNSTAAAFIKVIDPNNGFSLTTSDDVDMTNVSIPWNRHSVFITVPDSGFVGQILQFGFLNVASNYEPSGVFYDNLEVSTGDVVTAP